ncbi:MAG TPA: AAA family ATPase [Gemmatimonadaceae bacterium]|nr:AAA family ATPase [Gemmatimonadaceae bacterium]
MLIRSEHVRDEADEHRLLTNGHVAAQLAFGFVPGFEPKLATRYSDWLDQQRASASALLRRRFIAAMGAARDSVDWSDVDRLARLVLQIDPFNEEATLALAEATALLGSKAEALTMLSRYEQETGRTDLRLSASLLRRRISERLPDSAHQRPSGPFVGREAEAETIGSHIKLGITGRPVLLAISGEPGIGKTRLVDETTQLARLDGVQVEIVRCHPQHSVRPFSVFIDLVPTLLSLRGALGVSPRSLELLNLIVSHQDARGDRPSDVLDDSTRSGVLLASLRDLIDSVTSESPLLIAIEDAHWADDDSLRELGNLVCTAGRALVVICTTRHLDMLKPFLGQSAVLLRLQPLEQESMKQLAAYLLTGSQVSPSEMEWYARTAAGNPLFLEMLCAHFANTGEPFVVPGDLLASIVQRLEQLPGACRHLLEVCALLGRHCTLDAISTITSLTSKELLLPVRRLDEDGYLRITPDSKLVVHDLVKEGALKLLPSLTRAVLHRNVAEYLEKRFESSNDTVFLWDCAEHWSLSGDSQKALEFVMRCAQHAADMGRASQAYQLLERGRDFAHNVAERASVCFEMMRLAKAAGRWHDLLLLSKELRQLLDAIGRPISPTEELLTIEANWAMNSRVGEHVHKVLRVAQSSGASAAQRMEAANLALRVASEQGDQSLAKQAYDCVAPLLDADTGYYSRFVPLIYHTTFGSKASALSIARKLRDDLNTFESITQRLRAGLNVGTALVYLGVLHEALTTYRVSYELARGLGLTAWELDYACSMTWMYQLFDDFETAEEWHALSTQAMAATPNCRHHSARLFLGTGIELAIWRRDVRMARSLMNRFIELGSGDSVRIKAYLVGLDTRIRQLDQHYQCDDATLSELFVNYRAARSLFGADFVVIALGEGLLRRGQIEEAARLMDEYLQSWRRENSPVTRPLDEIRSRCAMATAARS